MDQIEIRGLRAFTRIGVTEEERKEPQQVVADISIMADLVTPAQTDDLNDTIDYSQVTARVTDVIRSSECRLLEHLAEKIASSIAHFAGVQGVTVEVAKQRPPLAEELEAVAVRIERTFG